MLAAAVADVEAAGGQGCALSVPADVTDTEKSQVAIDCTIDAFGGFDDQRCRDGSAILHGQLRRPYSKVLSTMSISGIAS